MSEMERNDTYGLTPRERDVIELIRRLASDEEIAERLGISYHTARTHVKQILRKMKVHSRHHAAAIYFGQIPH